jgi:class 3 adenylate cyclase/predicted ATPase
MDFTALRTQVIALLQREQRLSYRALQRQFALDDEDLEALKDELLYAKRLAVDEDGRVLVWTGGASSALPTASPVPLPATPDISPAQAGVSPVGPPTPAAERRQLTVMFCDLVASTQLASQLDPEDWRDVVRAYHAACTAIIQRYDGHIAQLLGDGLLLYFGYPHAHEDDAQRAVRAGLGMIAALRDLNQALQQAKGIQLAIRLGVHTGLVVIGAMGGPGRQEHLALGEVPNIASRIEGLAAANTVAISEATYRLVQGYFACQDLGAHALRGVTEAMRLYHVLGESGATSRLEVAQPRGLTPLVGREQEVGLLLERWEQVKAGHGHVVLLTGDAGIGKSRLIQILKEHVANEPHVRWECRSAEYSQNTVLFPLIDLFQRLLRFEAQETPDAKVEKLEHALSQYRLPLEASVPLLAPLLSVPLPEHSYPPLNLSPQRQRQKTLETIVALLQELAERHPVLFILEDLHWTDPSTLELMSLLLDQTPTASLLVLLTCRPHFQPPWHHRSYLTEMTVHRLSHAQVAQMVAGMTDGKTFPAAVLQQVMTKTDGVPLFVEEITQAILKSGQLKAVDGHYELVGSLSTFAIPATLQDSLMARLDRLVTAKAVAQYAAVIGRQFPYALLQAASQLDEAMLPYELGRLVEAEIVYQSGVPPQATYTFKHALIQDTAYQSLLKSTRQQYHQCIAQVLTERFPETAETQPELVAHHYTEAGLGEQAVIYWHRAGQQAVEGASYGEAVNLLSQGLALVKALPDTPARARQELALLVALGRAFRSSKGLAAPEVETTYRRAHELCRHVQDPLQLLPVLQGMVPFYLMREELQTARELGEQTLSLAQRVHDPAGLGGAHIMLGNALFFGGEFEAARTHLEQGLAFYTPQQYSAQGRLNIPHSEVFGRFRLAAVLWSLGYPEQALQQSQAALSLARERSQPARLAEALFYAAQLHRLRREAHLTYEHAEAALVLAREQGLPQRLAEATMERGWALVEQGQGEAGIAQLGRGLAADRATGARSGSYIALLAEALMNVGQSEEGLRVIAEVLPSGDSSEEGGGTARLYRLKGELLLARSSKHQAEAETCFRQALAVARRQQAKSWELRAAMSLARLWQQQGKRQEAYDLLAPVYYWFTEGFDTADLQEAKALLDALA